MLLTLWRREKRFMKEKELVSIVMGKPDGEMVWGGCLSIPLLGIFGIMGCGGIGRKEKSFGRSSTAHRERA
jgi:hypothetical protein